MSKAVEICERNELVGLIKTISKHYGGDDQEWLKTYATEIIRDKTRKEALECFRRLAAGLKPIVWKSE